MSTVVNILYYFLHRKHQKYERSFDTVILNKKAGMDGVKESTIELDVLSLFSPSLNVNVTDTQGMPIAQSILSFPFYFSFEFADHHSIEPRSLDCYFSQKIWGKASVWEEGSSSQKLITRFFGKKFATMAPTKEIQCLARLLNLNLEVHFVLPPTPPSSLTPTCSSTPSYGPVINRYKVRDAPPRLVRLCTSTRLIR
ncbi:hypothetical protein NE237_028458 [Protea cynaroides]|uniref:Uncharacterized protein n=1 Tax=Protea cynaroides TaxID=273540 RepID=A0A9Q0GR77_9MAGN|nr:hypothetical protein NE237_028458 [Protea cynaroides]